MFDDIKTTFMGILGMGDDVDGDGTVDESGMSEETESKVKDARDAERDTNEEGRGSSSVNDTSGYERGRRQSKEHSKDKKIEELRGQIDELSSQLQQNRTSKGAATLPPDHNHLKDKTVVTVDGGIVGKFVRYVTDEQGNLGIYCKPYGKGKPKVAGYSDNVRDLIANFKYVENRELVIVSKDIDMNDKEFISEHRAEEILQENKKLKDKNGRLSQENSKLKRQNRKLEDYTRKLSEMVSMLKMRLKEQGGDMDDMITVQKMQREIERLENKNKQYMEEKHRERERAEKALDGKENERDKRVDQETKDSKEVAFDEIRDSFQRFDDLYNELPDEVKEGLDEKKAREEGGIITVTEEGE